MWEMATGQRYFPTDWSLDGGRRMWSALCGFEPLPHELLDASQIRGVDRGVMKLVRRLLQRDPALRPSLRQLLAEKLFQARGGTTTQVRRLSLSGLFRISRGTIGICTGFTGIVHREKLFQARRRHHHAGDPTGHSAALGIVRDKFRISTHLHRGIRRSIGTYKDFFRIMTLVPWADAR
ncbi:hypothetical protein COO60DRAFT_45158 [Scenedesmus sp. NREL 46B-D3]|nr:hypothetical protein COO60DRAFT_45158 [Scenedesmus sp. NREL 46B-D3]